MTDENEKKSEGAVDATQLLAASGDQAQLHPVDGNAFPTPEELTAKADAAIRAAGASTEAELQAETVPTHNTIEELAAYINGLVDRPHSYGTCVYAMSHSAVAAFNFAASKLGVTGFQASCADMDILGHTRNFHWGRLINYEDLLYPQYTIPTVDAILENHKEAFAKKALKLLQDCPDAHPNVKAHWVKLVAAVPEVIL